MMGKKVFTLRAMGSRVGRHDEMGKPVLLARRICEHFGRYIRGESEGDVDRKSEGL